VLVKVEYIGPFDVVLIEHPVGADFEIERGVPVELPGRIASSLCEQVDCWRLVPQPEEKDD